VYACGQWCFLRLYKILPQGENLEFFIFGTMIDKGAATSRAQKNKNMEKSKTQPKDRLRNWLLFVGLLFAILAIFFTDLEANPNKGDSTQESMPTNSELQSDASLFSSAAYKIYGVVSKIGKGTESNF
jgi:hypothetical protein